MTFSPGLAGSTTSQVIAGKSELSKVKEFKSFATMNVAWLCVTKTLSMSASSLNQSSMPRSGMLPFSSHWVLTQDQTGSLRADYITDMRMIDYLKDSLVCRRCDEGCSLCVDKQHS